MGWMRRDQVPRESIPMQKGQRCSLTFLSIGRVETLRLPSGSRARPRWGLGG